MIEPKFTIDEKKVSPTSSLFTIEPLPQGFGSTLGTSIRRVLYSSIRGSAVTSVIINGSAHQFSSIEGIKEDVLGIILNIKRLRVKYAGETPTTITLSAKGSGEVFAKDFNLPAGVSIANPDLSIATLTDKSAKLEIEAVVESGYGYSPAEDRKSSTVGVIVVDATFSPVLRVNSTVESTRVGRLTNFDKLILEVVTDGTISPREALDSSSKTLSSFISFVSDPSSSQSSSDSSKTVKSTAASLPGNNVTLEELDLPTRIANALQKAGMQTAQDIVSMPKAQLAKVKNLGEKSVDVVEAALKERGFSLVD